MIGLWHRLPPQFEDQLAAIAGRVSAYHFDDGYDDVLVAADALERLGLQGVFFIISGAIGRPGFATAEQVAELAARGHEVGNHTRRHRMMDLIRHSTVRYGEVQAAQVRLAEIVGTPPRRFAWPHGRHNAAADATLARFGFTEVRDISNVVRNAARKTVAELVELVG